MNKPLIGISACLLGRKVRYDGEHKKNDWLVQELARWVEWVPVCPELEMGLGVPRETMRLKLNERGEARLVANQSKVDLTDLARDISAGLVEREFLPKVRQIDGFIFKKDSPSCGLERVKVYGRSGMPVRSGTGFFAEAFKRALPEVATIEEGRLSDPVQREGFVTRIFGAARLRETQPRMAELQRLHQRSKFLILAHSPEYLTRLGQVVANPSKLKPLQVFEKYRTLYLQALEVPSTLGRRVNALEHMFGFFKELVDAKDKLQFKEVIDEYRQGHEPLSAPLAVLRHFAQRLDVGYVRDQYFLEPYPKALGLSRYT